MASRACLTKKYYWGSHSIIGAEGKGISDVEGDEGRKGTNGKMWKYRLAIISEQKRRKEKRKRGSRRDNLSQDDDAHRRNVDRCHSKILAGGCDAPPLDGPRSRPQKIASIGHDGKVSQEEQQK